MRGKVFQSFQHPFRFGRDALLLAWEEQGPMDTACCTVGKIKKFTSRIE
jgi:hypothetical protein